MAVRTVEELVIKMNAILHKWHSGTRHGNHGDAGNTLEDLLGIAENNFRLPDFGEIEIKTQKFEGKDSLLTLFHKEPKNASSGASVPNLLKSIGWPHSEAGKKYPKTEMSFRSTTPGERFTDRGFTIIATSDKIEFVYNPKEVKRAVTDRTANFPTYGDWADAIEQRNAPHYRGIFPVYYETAEVAQTFVDKLSHTLLVRRKTRTTADGNREYWYEEAYLMKEVKTDMIVPLINEGALVVDFDARTGHNHGTKFRIKKSKAKELFTEFKLME